MGGSRWGFYHGAGGGMLTVSRGVGNPRLFRKFSAIAQVGWCSWQKRSGGDSRGRSGVVVINRALGLVERKAHEFCFKDAANAEIGP